MIHCPPLEGVGEWINFSSFRPVKFSGQDTTGQSIINDFPPSLSPSRGRHIFQRRTGTSKGRNLSHRRKSQAECREETHRISLRLANQKLSRGNLASGVLRSAQKDGKKVGMVKVKSPMLEVGGQKLKAVG